MYAARALFVSKEITFVDGTLAVESPDFSEPQDFAKRLAITANSHKVPEMTVILDDCATKILKLPRNAPQKEEVALNHRTLQAWRADGWRVSQLSPWFTLWAPGRPSIHFGVKPWLGKGNNALHTTDEGGLTYRLRWFQSLTGTAFHGNPGLAATANLRDRWTGKDEPLWRPKWDRCVPAGSDCEKPFVEWHRQGAGGLPWQHHYDCNRQYLAAAHNTVVAPGPLRHKGFQAFNRQPGYWLIRVPHFNETRLPHPAGYAAGAEAWVATPTMELLHELADQGLMPYPDVLDSWTADGRGRELFRPWVARIEDAYQHSLTDETPDGQAVTIAVKGMYKHGVGLMHSKKARVWRPDWHHSIISKARANLWRKMFAVGLYQNRWPVYIDYDLVAYESTKEHPSADPPLRMFNGHPAPVFPIVDRLGGFTVETKRRAA